MSDDFEVTGADTFLRLSRALKDAGRTQMRKDLSKGLRTAAKPLVAETRAEALRRLPQRGGLARQVAKEPQRIQVRTGARTAGARLVVGNRRGGARAANRGVIRHPVFGNRKVWVNQRVRPGWFDDPAAASAPRIRRELERTIDEIAGRVVRDAG